MKAWKIRGLALVACLAFVTMTCEPKNGGVADHRSTATVTLTEADGRGGVGSGGVSYGVDDATSEATYKSEARESNRYDTSDSERSDRRSGKRSESGGKGKSDKKHGSKKEDKPEQKDKSHKRGEFDKRESDKAGSGSSERSAPRNYHFGDDDDETVMPDGTFIGGDDPITVVKTHNDVARISSSGGIARVEDDVKEIDVYESDVDVVADSAVKMRILGSDVGVFVRSVSSVHFDDSDNNVR